MNGMRIATIICWAVSALVLIGLLVWFLVGFAFGGDGIFRDISLFGMNIRGTQNLTGPYEKQSEYAADTANISTLRVNWVAGEITVTPHDGDKVLITELAQRELKNDEKMHITTDGNTLTIRFHERRSMSGRLPRKNLEILVPRELSDSLASLNINTTSGSVDVDSINAVTTNISSVSASTDIRNITSQKLDISTTSGASVISSVNADRIDVSSVSGSLTITDTLTPILSFSTTSGRTNASGEFDRVDVSSVSGNVVLSSTTVPSRIDISTVSGATDIYIPNDGEIAVSHSAVSGRFSSEIPVTMQNGAPYSFSAVSGNTNIHVLG